MRLALIITIGTILGSASGTGCQQPDTRELEAETTELRSELREMREEIRTLRKETRELREKVDLGGAARADTPPPVVATAPTTDAGAAAELPPQDNKAPAQGNVKISIESNPRGATVFLEDRALGRTPLLYEHAPSTTQLILRIEKPGFRPRLMSIRPDEDAKISVQLARQSR